MTKKEALINPILKKIQDENITMRSRSYFVIRTILWVFAAIFVFGASVYIVSMASFVFTGKGLGLLSGFGISGVMPFMRALPWALIGIAVMLLILLELLTVQFRFVYRRPLFVSVIISIVVVVLVATVVSRTTIHHRAFELSHQGRLPIIGGLYREALKNGDEIHTGVILSLKNSQIEFLRDDGKTMSIELTDNTRIPKRVIIAEGMEVMVLGVAIDSNIKAVGIRPLNHKRKKYLK